MKDGLLGPLLSRFRDRSAVVGVVGLGYVGLPLALRFAEVGYRVLGFDIDAAKVAALNGGRSYIERISPQRVSNARKNFEATGQYARAAECDAIAICVPTPLDRQRQPDLSFVTGTVESLLPHLRAGQLLVLESTTWPGTTEEVLRPRVESRGLKIGENFYLCFSPEREDPGNPRYATQTIPKICGGSTPACLEAGLALYGQAIDRVVPVSSTRVAEMVKLLENTFRSVNIGLVNELALMCDKMGIDVWEVIDGAASKPFGFMPFYPGPGLGGHCIPVDPFYLSWKARESGFEARFIELAGQINGSMPYHVARRVSEALNARRRSVRGSKILLLGVAYKANIDDVRESPSLDIIQILEDQGAKVQYSDPHVPSIRHHGRVMRSTPLRASTLRAADCVVIATAHKAFDLDLIAREARTIVDSRNALRGRRRNGVHRL